LYFAIQPEELPTFFSEGLQGSWWTLLSTPIRRNESDKEGANQHRRNIMKVEIIETFNCPPEIIFTFLTDMPHHVAWAEGQLS
jgi:hypothetical protein